MRKIIFVKIGGSLITDKTKPYTAKPDLIIQVTQNIALFHQENPHIQFIIGTGAGSFGHYPVVTHHLQNGARTIEQNVAIGHTNQSVARLNQMVVTELINHKLPVMTIHPSSFLTASDQQVQASFFDPLDLLLERKIVPSVYGSVILDKKQGCTIFSTEQVFDSLIQHLIKREHNIAHIIHLTTVPGVYNAQKQVFPLITADNFAEVKSQLYETEGYDVTGGMLHKIQQSLQYTKFGIKTHIISGLTSLGCIFESNSSGTLIR